METESCNQTKNQILALWLFVTICPFNAVCTHASTPPTSMECRCINQIPEALSSKFATKMSDSSPLINVSNGEIIKGSDIPTPVTIDLPTRSNYCLFFCFVFFPTTHVQWKG